MPKKVLFVSHKKQRCGVYQLGASTAQALQRATHFQFSYLECENAREFVDGFNRERPEAVFYNHHPSTMPWLNRDITARLQVPHIGFVHEIHEEMAESLAPGLFDYFVAADPTLESRNPKIFKVGRLVPPYENRQPLPEITTIGSFGFATGGKGFEQLVRTVDAEFDRAVIRLHIPRGDFAVYEPEQIVQRCRSLITRPGIRLESSHEFLPQDRLLDFLGSNTINAFFYGRGRGRGISSVIDYALAVDRPIAVSRSAMFRHIIRGNPFVTDQGMVVDSTAERVLKRTKGILRSLAGRGVSAEPELPPLHRILAAGTRLQRPFTSDWTPANLVMDYERAVRRAFGDIGFHQSRNKIPSATTVPDNLLAENISFNRILDDSARSVYRPVVEELHRLVPETMARKIPRANVQQAFIFDTVRRLVPLTAVGQPMLCIGSHADSAFGALRKLGFPVVGIDPVENDVYFSEFFHRAESQGDQFSFIFATSVLEHVMNDELFVEQMAALLAPGGIGVLTCDFRDDWRPGQPKPKVDHRLYTRWDLYHRLIPLLDDCRLIDPPYWENDKPDFLFEGRYRYTFATLTFQKSSASSEGRGAGSQHL